MGHLGPLVDNFLKLLFSLCTGNISVFLCIVLVFLKTGHFKKYVCSCSVAQSCLTLCNPMEYIDRQAPLSMGISRQEYWSGFPFPTPGYLPDPGIEPTFNAWAGGFFTTEQPGKLLI